jgi:hypothetical protein
VDVDVVCTGAVPFLLRWEGGGSSRDEGANVKMGDGLTCRLAVSPVSHLQSAARIGPHRKSGTCARPD